MTFAELLETTFNHSVKDAEFLEVRYMYIGFEINMVNNELFIDTPLKVCVNDHFQ